MQIVGIILNEINEDLHILQICFNLVLVAERGGHFWFADGGGGSRPVCGCAKTKVRETLGTTRAQIDTSIR